MTMDGKIATVTGDSKYISAEDSLRIVHRLRSEIDAILIGGNTAIKDNPLLTVRHIEGEYKNPIRIIIDVKKGLSENLNVFKNRSIAETWVVTSYERDYSFADKIIKIKSLREGHISFSELMKELGSLGISSILIEGGGRILASAFEQNVVDKIYCFVCPKIFGGEHAIDPVMGLGIAQKVNEAINLKISSLQKLNQDILIESYVMK